MDIFSLVRTQLLSRLVTEMTKYFYKLTTFGLLIAFFFSFYHGFKKYESHPIGNSVKYEKNTKLPDFTFCPWFYYKNLNLSNITSNSGHKVQDVLNYLPSTKTLMIYGFKGKFGGFDRANTSASDNIFENATWVESIKINEQFPYNILRCVTIQWPDIQLEMDAYLSFNLGLPIKTAHLT